MYDRSQSKKKEKARFRILQISTMLLLAVLCMISILPSVRGDYVTEPQTMGVNYGQVANNLPSGADAVNLIKNLGAGRVKIYDTDAGTLKALANSGLEVVVGMSNDEIPSLATSAEVADQWIVTNVVAYVPATNITVILVGNELFADPTNSNIWPQLVPAIQNLQTSLTTHGLASSIKLSTACEFSILTNSYPPSAVLTDGQFGYTNLLEAQLDAIYYAMEALGFKNVRIALSESGWPTAGGIGANISNAQAYNGNLVKYILSGQGTPKRPQVFVPTYVFALFNEDMKPGAPTEQHWGVLYPNGSAVYPFSLTTGLSSSPGSPNFPSPGSPDSSTNGSGELDPPGGTSHYACGDRPSVLPLSFTFLGSMFNLRI
ncbi:unnamed protein product [Sphagnum jensenii]|uniref:Beta-1,3-glucanase n=1 Tax=Sphagnum jensenii TaxID=128206 RepID=A0ABP1BR43_9BRYO